jgi:replication initiation and membrane attachment protein
MKILEKNSYCSIRQRFALSQTDHEVMSFLYLPVIKSDASSLYYALYHYASLNPLLGGFVHEDLLDILGMNETDFMLARTKLEGIGLIEVYRKEERDSSSQVKANYIYQLLPPASPKKFFNDILLRTLLNEQVGNKRYYFLFNYFKVDDPKLEEGYINTTTPFKDVFTPVVKDGSLSLESFDTKLEDKTYKSQCQFDRKELKQHLKVAQYSFDILKPYIKEVEATCALYDPSIEDVVSIIIDNTDSDGIFYIERFKDDIRNLRQFATVNRKNTKTENLGHGEYAKLVEKFNALTPDEYLGLIYNAKPATFMLKEIEKMKSDLGFTNPIINVVLDYCFRKTNNEFNVNYIDKVAYTLSSLDVEDAYDAMTKLNSRDFEASQVSRKRSSRRTKVAEEKEETEEKKETDTLSELDALSEALGL